CLTGSSKFLPTHARGHIITLQCEPTRLYFIGRRGWKKISKRVELDGYEVSRERRFLSEDLVFYAMDKRPAYTFVFDRTRAGMVKLIAQTLKGKLGTRPAAPAALAT